MEMNKVATAMPKTANVTKKAVSSKAKSEQLSQTDSFSSVMDRVRSDDGTDSSQPAEQQSAQSAEQEAQPEKAAPDDRKDTSKADKPDDAKAEDKTTEKSGQQVKEKTADDDNIVRELPEKEPEAQTAGSTDLSLISLLALGTQTADMPAQDIAQQNMQPAATLPTTQAQQNMQASSVIQADIPTVSTGENSHSLETLLPQDEQAAGQNQQLMEMLDSQSSSAKLAQNMQPVNQAGIDAKDTSLLAQANIVSGSEAQTEILPEGQSTGQAQLLAAESVPVQAAEPKTAAAKDVDSQSNAPVSDLLGDTPLQVEIKPAAQQQLPQQDSKGGQAQQQAAQAAPPQQQEQLPEEAAFDTAPLPNQETQPSAGQPASAMPLGQTTTGTVMQTAETAVPAQGEVQQTADFDVPRQIVEQARLIKSTDSAEMIIKLKPEHLGELTLKVAVTANGSVNASFHTDNAQVRGIIEASMVQLKQELQAQGLKVDNVGVYAGLSDGSLPDGQAQQQYQQQTQNSARSSSQDMADFAEDAESLQTAVQNRDDSAAGVDYRI